MIRSSQWLGAFAASTLLGIAGCSTDPLNCSSGESRVCNVRQTALEIEYPEITPVCRLADADQALAPRTLLERGPTDYWDLEVQEAVQISLANSKVMRDLGGRIVSSPTAVGTVYEPAITESDPRFGVEGALSAFDAELSTSVFWERNERPLNQVSPGVFPPIFEQDLAVMRTQIQKTNATGGTWALRNNTRYDYNNNPNNRFPSVWETDIEAEVRQPLLQGAGITFNRIAGPGATPGFFFSNGVLIARVNTDIALADFEAGVRNLVSEVENAYWDLYFAYRDLDAKIKGRDAALETWRRVRALQEAGEPGGGAADEAQAREQYYLFRALVEDALSGTPGGSTQGGSGSASGQFRAAGGVYAREANLRFLMGLAHNDGRLIRPASEPLRGRLAFDWNQVICEALCRRVELRRQRWLVKRRELELCASKNFLMPNLDLVGLYRWYGLGDDLVNYDDDVPFQSATRTLAEGDFQEWQMGVQFVMPLGERQAHAAVRNAELQLARDRAVLQEQELAISHDLAGALRELDRAYQLTETNWNRYIAAQRQVDALDAERMAGRGRLDVVLDAQRRLADAETNYFRSLVEYNLAFKSIHFEKGSLLDYTNVYLTEGPWPLKAYQDAQDLAESRSRSKTIDYGFQAPGAFSAGPVPQQTVEGYAVEGHVVEPYSTPAPTRAPEEIIIEDVPAGEREIFYDERGRVSEFDNAIPADVEASAGGIPGMQSNGQARWGSALRELPEEETVGALPPLTSRDPLGWRSQSRSIETADYVQPESVPQGQVQTATYYEPAR